MKIKKFTFPSSNGRDTISATEWVPDGKIKGILQIVHGMQEHMGQYNRFAQTMCAYGFCVIGMDCIGHGDSAPEGELGYFADPDSSEFLVMDIRMLTLYARKKYKKHKLFIYGHSFGSFQTRLYISRYRDIDGAILASTGDMPLQMIAQTLKLLRGQIQTHGGDYRSTAAQKLIFGKFVRKFLPMKTNFDWVTRDEGRVREYLEDAKFNYLFTLNGFYTLLSTVMKCDFDAVFDNTPKNLPILVIAGSDDGVGDYGRGTQRVYDRFIESGHTNAELKMFIGARHNLLHETNFEEVQVEIGLWLEKNL